MFILSAHARRYPCQSLLDRIRRTKRVANLGISEDKEYQL